MIGYASTRTLLAGAALAFAALVPVAPTTAQAQGLSWLWGGGSQVGGSGKEIVRFGVQHRPGQVIVSFGDRRLYWVTKPGEAISYPIAVPREQSRWQGTLQVSSKRVDPPWTPTAEMLRENPKLPRHVPGGHPMNPMGARALYLGATMYRIHGTDAPWSIGQAVSKGCIRMYNKDVIDLYDRIPVGTRVTVTWNRYTTSAAPVASWGGGSGVVDRTASRSSSGFSSSSGFGSGFIFPWMDQEEPAPRRADRPKQRAQQKRPVSSGNAPKKQEQTPVSSNAVAPQQSVSVH
ncbi:MAG: L,D-transpeptidase [Hyphomicrobium sp.]|nr:L,D-transpeptidase [Hyphomicrobium sp.]